MSGTATASVMRLINEITEIFARIQDLGAFVSANKGLITPTEAKLILAQANAMSLYAEILEARLQLLTGVKL